MYAPVYLDYNANAPLDPVAREAMLPFLDARFGNASSRHEYGRQARAAIDQARAQLAAAVGAHPTEVVFTSGGSEANNLFLKGFAAARRPGLIAIGATEHPCVREPARQLARQGWRLETLAVDKQGQIDAAAFEAALLRKPEAVSIMLANNETGVLQDIFTLAARACAAGAVFHSDAVQALGKVDVNFRALGVQAMTLSAHKIGGPIGAGALILNKRIELAPLIAGGGQERGLRSGTENVAAIVGFGCAAERAVAMREAFAKRSRQQRDRLEAALSAQGAWIFGAAAERLPNTVFFAFDAIDGETLVAKLDRAGFAVASGSACSSADPQPSVTLLAMEVEPGLARGALRVSLGRATQGEEIERFARVLGETVAALRQMTGIAA
ncbi:MAG: cysteine desulfurase [Betaproteobacteria bacterium]|nr:cysteine desulfurase [Betaproteobacteria bacterium]